MVNTRKYGQITKIGSLKEIPFGPKGMSFSIVPKGTTDKKLGLRPRVVSGTGAQVRPVNY
jgi:hypothetical protein